MTDARLIAGIAVIMRECWDLPSDLQKGELQGTHPVKTAVRSFIGGSANIFYECTSANNREQMLRLILLRHLPS
jgi:hypothetical protein